MTYEEWKDRFIIKLSEEAHIQDEEAERIFDDLGFDSLEDIPDDFIDDPEGAAMEEIDSWREDDEIDYILDNSEDVDEYEP